MSLEKNEIKMNHYKSLIVCLEQLIKVYRHLLGVVRQEKQILINSNLDELNENNKTKEATLIKLKSLETQRIKHARDLAEFCGADTGTPRLLEIANHFEGESSEKLRNLHSVLDLLVKRVNEINKENEGLVQSALNTISGAMNSIKETLTEKPVYGQKGGMKSNRSADGSLLNKEV